MAQIWIQQLAAAESIRGVSSSACRQRAVATIGASATAWGIAVSRRMAASILNVLDDWSGDRSMSEVESLQRATEASTLDTLCALVTGDVDTLARSHEPRENVAFYVANGIPLEQVIRNVHAGQDFIAQELLEAIGREVAEDGRMDAIRETNRIVAMSWARLISAVSAEYAREYERWTRSAEAARAQVIRRILSGDEAGDDELGAVLGYDLDQEHVGIVVWLEIGDVETARLFNYEVFARELAEAAGSPVPPVVHFAASTHAELWIGSPARRVCEAFESRAWPNRLRIAIGRPGRGRRAFRTSAIQARTAHALARRSTTLGDCVRFDDIELVALLANEPERAADFARRELGPLAADDARAAELRTTLAAWMDHQGSLSAVSKQLFMHRNSVAYRVRQAQELIGRDVDRLRMRCALLLAEVLPDDVLEPAVKATDTSPVPVP